MSIKSILFNTGMVRAILDGRKTVTRRVIKPQPKWGACSMRWYWKDIGWWYDGWNPVETITYKNMPYQPGDYLYVRETFSPMYESTESNKVVGYMYKADPTGENAVKEYDRKYPDGADYTWDGKWHPSIHMPKEAARIWLKVTDVRVERLQDITNDDAISEGIEPHCYQDENGNIEFESSPIDDFAELWDSTIKKKDLSLYGWDASPWVWVIEFERCEKPEED